MAQKKLLMGNWKLHHNRSTAAHFFAELTAQPLPLDTVELAIAPVAPMLDFVGARLAKTGIKLAAQNVYYEPKGAFTGEYAAEHLSELGVTYCLVGHSERRKLFFETDDTVLKKAQACLRAQVTPVICVGESATQKEQGLTEQVISSQLNVVLDALVDPGIVIAYEPIWAIGTGKTPTPTEVQMVHQLIRNLLLKRFLKAADAIPLLYGGSVNAENISDFMMQNDVDGALVGGASLQAASFLSMVKALQEL